MKGENELKGSNGRSVCGCGSASVDLGAGCVEDDKDEEWALVRTCSVRSGRGRLIASDDSFPLVVCSFVSDFCPPAASIPGATDPENESAKAGGW